MPSARPVLRELAAYRGMWACWGVVLAAAIALAVLAGLDDRLPGDLSASSAVQDWPFPGEPFADVLRLLSGTEVVAGIGAVLAVIAWLAGRRRPALALAAGLAVMVLLQFAVKEIVDRPRPPPDLVDLRAGFTSPSFPSGHTMSPSYLYGFLAAATLASSLPRGLRAAAVAGVAAFLLLGGLANVYLGVHWTSDVIGGYLWALLVLIPAARAAFPSRP
ncbi:MAG: phosphatase PAP2 family protein [Dehalococcoidia bacterium]|nr:phosphatase PAP2 family protein [Dehalococcoidia bacterium]